MEDIYVHLDSFGLPHVRLHRSGRMVDEISRREIVPDKHGLIYVADRFGDRGRCLHVRLEILMNHYFRNPLLADIRPICVPMDRFGFPGYWLFQNGQIWCPWLARYITVYLQKGYPTARLHGADGKDHTVSIHRMLALAWVPNPDPATKNQVNHIDGNPQNNSLSNLEWCTNSENQRHAARLGLHHRSIPPEMAHRICQLACQGYTNREIFRMLGYTDLHDYDKIRHITEGGYHDISLQYNLPNRVM